CALRGVLVAKAIGPLAESGLDEALGLAVGLRPVGSGESVSNAELLASGGEVLGSEAIAVVSEEPAHRNPEAFEVGHGVAKELDGAVDAFVAVHVGEADAGVVIDRYKQVFPAGPLDLMAPIGRDSVTGPFNAPELLGVDMKQ